MNETHHTAVALLAAARELFARNGYEGTSIRAITSLADANLGAVTYHYVTKARLYEAVLESVTVPLLERTEGAASAAPTPLDGIAAVVRVFFEHSLANPDWSSLIVHELALDRPLPAPARRVMQRVFEVVSELVRRGQADGSIVAGELFLHTFSVVSQPMYFALVRRRLYDAFGLDSEDPATHRRIVEHVVRFVRRSLATPGRNP